MYTNGAAAVDEGGLVDGRPAVRFAGDEGTDTMSETYQEKLSERLGSIDRTLARLEGTVTGFQDRLSAHARDLERRQSEDHEALFGKDSTTGLLIRVDRIEQQLRMIQWIGGPIALGVLSILLSIYVPACERIAHERPAPAGAMRAD